MTTAYEQQLKNLWLVERARLHYAMAANAAHSSYAAGSSNPVLYPDPRQMAFEAMGNQMPSFTPEPVVHKGGGILNGIWNVLFPFQPKTGILEHGPGKAALELLSRPMQAVESGVGASVKDVKEHGLGTNPLSEIINAAALPFKHAPDMLKGLTGAEHTSGSQIISTVNPGAPSLAKGIGGFALDVGLDPLMYVNPASVATKAKDVASLAKAATGAKVVTVGAEAGQQKALEDAANIANREPLSAPSNVQQLTYPGTPQIESATSGIQANQIRDILSGAPNAAPFEAPAPFKEAMVPVERKTVDPRVGVLRAIKAAILQSPDYKLAGRPVADQLSEPGFEAKLNQHVKDLYANKAYDKIPQSITFTGRTGRPNVARLTLQQAADLFSKGEVPNLKTYSEASDALTHKYPLHDVEDLQNITLKNAQGNTVTLAQYLEELGLPVTKIGAEGLPIIPKFDINAVPAKSAKTVYERSKVVKLADQELEDWSKQHLGSLSAKERQYLRDAKTRADFTKRLASLNAKRITTGFKNIDDFVAAAKTGIIPKETIDKMLKVTGAKSVDELSSKVKDIISKTGGTPKTPTFEDFAAGTKFEKITGPSPDPRFDAAHIIEQASQGDLSRIRKPVPEVTPNIVEDLSQALPQSIIDNLITPAMKKEYPYVTKFKRTLRTHRTPGVGRGRNYFGWNSFSQSDLFRSLVKSSSARHFVSKNLNSKERRAAFAQRPTAMYNDVMSALRVAEAALKKEGVKIVAGHDNSGILLSLGDVLDSLPESVVKSYLFNMGGKGANVYPTAFLDAAASLAQAKIGKVSEDVAKANAVNIIKASGNMADKEKVAEDIVRIIDDNMPQIMARVNANYAEHAIKVGESVRSMTDEVVHNLITKYANPDAAPGEVFGDLVTRNEDLAKAGKNVNAPADALPTAKGVADLQLSRVLDPGDLAEANVAKTMESAVDLQEAAKVGTRQQASRSSEAVALANPEDITDLGSLFNARLQAGSFRANVPILDKAQAVVNGLGQMFMPHFGHADLHDMVWVERNVTQSFMRMHRALMQNAFNIAKATEHPAETLRQAWRHLQDPTIAMADSPDTNVVQAMRNSLDLLFGSSEPGHGAFAIRNGLFSSRLNRNLRYFGVPAKYSFKEGVPLIKQANVWKTWEDVEDPLDLLDRVHAAFQKATVDVTIGRDFSDVFGVATKRPGYVKLADPHGRSHLFPFIDSELFYPGEIVDQLPFLEKAMSGTYMNTPAAIRWYDNILHKFKAGMTIYRPGHHVRNLVGDLTLAYLQGVKDPRVFDKGIRIMAGRSKMYRDWDGLKALEDGVGLKGTQDGARVFTTIGKKKIDLGDDQVWRAAFNEGLLPDFRVLEDISFSELQPFAEKLRKPFGGHVQAAAGGLSMARDHWVRISHFVDLLQKGSYSSLDEAFKEAGKTVRKWHPDGSDLTHFERTVMRRLIPFYSWMRKAIPLTVESLVMSPGRALVIPKGFYNFAVANGVDPDTIADPFPSDQLFPSWLQDNVLGPQWRGGLPGIPGTGGQYPNRYHGFNPGDPITDILGQALGAQPTNFFAGQLTPALRIPIEEQTGKILATGSDITSQPEYLDQQIPGVGYLSNILNRSILGGTPQQDVTKGNQQPGIDTMALFNFLTGLGLRDYSKPNYIRSAVLELRNRNG